MPPLLGSGDGQNQQPPKVQIPKPGVPQIMTLEGTYVRAAYNNEGYAILGYKLANLSIGEKWMLLEFGATVRDGVPNYRLTRDGLSLETPDGKTTLASEAETEGGRGRCDASRSSATRSTTSRRTPARRARSSSSPTSTAGRCPGTRSS
jgi:hypothetical protein